MKKIFLTIFMGTLSAYEPSAFGAGDLDSPVAYGLDSSEKKIIKNSKSIRVINSKIENLLDELESLKLISKNINSTLIKKTKNSTQKELINIKESLSIQNQKLQTFSSNFKKALKEISWIVDDINQKFISKTELEKTLNQINKRIHKLENKKVPKTKSTKNKKTSSNLFTINKSLNNWELQSKVDTFYKNGDYSSIKEVSLYLIKKGFKPAKNRFYLGEVHYQNQNYIEAVKEYKKSLQIYDDASYTPKLLLHSAFSLKNLDQDTQAKKFLNLIIEKFPNSDEAKKAKKLQ